MFASNFFSLLLNTAIEEHYLNGIVNYSTIIHLCPYEVFVLNKCKFWLDLVL